MADDRLLAEDVLCDRLLFLDGEPRDAAGRAGYRPVTGELVAALFAAAGDPDELVLRRTPEGTELLVAEALCHCGDPTCSLMGYRHRALFAAPTAGNETTDYSRHHFAAPDTGSDDGE